MKGHFLCRLFWPKEIFLTFVFYLNVQCMKKLSEYTYFYISKNITYFCLFLKLLKALSISLSALTCQKLLGKCHCQACSRSSCVKSAQIRSFFWSVFSRIRTKYRDILFVFPYSLRLRENTDQKNLRILTLFTQYIFLRNEAGIVSTKTCPYLKFSVNNAI